MDNKTGAFIAELRKEKQLTQKELAQKLNVTDKAISRWETGKGFPEVSLLIPLSNELGISVNELLTGERVDYNEMIDNSNKIIVDTIKNSDKKIKILNTVISAIFVIVELATFYIVPATAQPGDEMGVIFLSILAVFVISVPMGFVKSKLKMLVPLFSAVVFIPSMAIPETLFFYFDGSDVVLYFAIYLAVSLFGLLLGVLIDFVVKLIIKCISKSTN